MTQVFTTEHETVQKIARWLSESDAGSMLSEKALRKLAGWMVTRRGVLGVWFDEITPAETRDMEQLRQQQVSHYSDEDSILERLHEIARNRELADAEEHLLQGYLHGMGSAYALPDRDERGADEDDRRLSREAADEKAAAGMPKVAGL